MMRMKERRIGTYVENQMCFKSDQQFDKVDDLFPHPLGDSQ